MEDRIAAHYLHLAGQLKRPLTVDPEKPLQAQKEQVYARLTALLRMPQGDCRGHLTVQWENKENPAYNEIRFQIETEPGFFVPAHLLLPKEYTGKLPVMICLQGHSTGMHISLGRSVFPGDQELIDGDRDFACQAVRQGYAAIAMEQRGFGELKTKIGGNLSFCHQVSMQALLLGRTLLGDRIHDISRLIDCLGEFPMLDTDRIGIMGNSGGGTAAYHAAAVDSRITHVLASCAFNEYASSILPMYHCACNYVPGLLEHFEMSDLAVLIAPRPLLIVSGRTDDIFPLEASRRAFGRVQDIYAAAGAKDQCRLVVGEGGHRFYAKDAWPAMAELTK